MIRAGKRSSVKYFTVRNSQYHWKQWSITHPQAFGIAFPDGNVEKFVTYADEQLKDIKFQPAYKVDFIWHLTDVLPENILTIGEAKALWGQEINEPYIVIENLAVTKNMLTLMSPDKRPTIKIQLPSGVSIIKFKSSQEEYDSLYSEMGCVYITLIGKCAVNKYYETVTPQIIVEDYEVINRQEYYF